MHTHTHTRAMEATEERTGAESRAFVGDQTVAMDPDELNRLLVTLHTHTHTHIHTQTHAHSHMYMYVYTSVGTYVRARGCCRICACRSDGRTKGISVISYIQFEGFDSQTLTYMIIYIYIYRWFTALPLTAALVAPFPSF